jgi:arylsulfatase A-like enzyme
MGLTLPVQATQQPDIILIITDQQTASAMSCAGNPNVHTPAMDELAKDGVRFNRAYVSYPLSGPSRASLFTGKTAWELGIKDNDDTMQPQEMQLSLGFQVSAAGYDCLYAGKWHVPEVNIPETGTGFQKICNMNDAELVAACLPHIREKRENPMFLVASFLNPHEICEFARGESLPFSRLSSIHPEDYPQLPYNFSVPGYYPEALTLHQDAVPKSYPARAYTDDDWRKYLSAYYQLVETVDAEIGKLIAALKANGKYDNSLIIFMSDHGDGVGAHRWNQKRSLQEEVIHVPFIIKPPRKQGIVNEVNEQALVNVSLDVYPTVCDYAQVNNQSQLAGISLRKVLEGKTKTHHEKVFVETLLDGINVRAWGVIGNTHKYVLYNYYKNREQLFDLETDRYEMNNLIHDKNQKATIDELRKDLYDWGVSINDARLVRQLKNYIQ